MMLNHMHTRTTLVLYPHCNVALCNYGITLGFDLGIRDSKQTDAKEVGCREMQVEQEQDQAN